MSCVVIDEKDTPKLQVLGVKDSKLLTPKKRQELYQIIIKTVKDYKIVIIPPKEIDDALMSENINLNWLEAIKSAELVKQVKADEVILDCPSNNTQAYKEYFQNVLKNDNIKVIAEHKADVKYPVVSAASILAKVTRDNEIDKIKQKVGKDIGSGYPADEITQKFIKENYQKHPEIFRHTWSTYKKVVEGKKQKSLTQF